MKRSEYVRTAVRAVATLVVVLSAVAAALVASAPAAEAAPVPGSCRPGSIRSFTDVEFRDLFNGLQLPATAPITSPPPIFGDAAADARIQSLATARGYRLRSVPTSPLVSADGQLIQSEAAAAWRALQSYAAASGRRLVIGSGYRSIEVQAGIVRRELSGWSTTQIASGQADAAISSMLRWHSIPGYSRHHTGYAMDIAVAGQAHSTFGSTEAYRWISADNYRIAKQFGFIPSYPPGAAPQGPEPEPWEFTYVGAAAVTCPPELDGATTLAGDFDGDGHGDVVAFYDYGGADTAAFILYGNGTGLTAPQPTWSSGPGNWDWNRTKLTAANPNGDAYTDVVALYDYGGGHTAAFVLYGNGTGLWAPQPTWSSGPGNWDWNRTKLTAANPNGDAYTDVVALYDYGGGHTAAFVLYGNGTGLWAPQPTWSSGPGNWDWNRTKLP